MIENKTLPPYSLDENSFKDLPFTELSEAISRPESLSGTTYKIKTPTCDEATYVTINDIILNPETEYEKVLPYEIFINSKNMENFMWISTVTRLISAIFRKGGDIEFLVEELDAIFDPKGGHWHQKKYYNSLIARIGMCIYTHLQEIKERKTPIASSLINKDLEEKREK